MSFRILLVGLGNRGGQWAEIVSAHAQATLACAVDPDPAARARFGTRFPGVPVLADMAVALRDVECDAVLLATPPDGHLAQTDAVFARGLPVLCEKPLDVDLAAAKRIVDNAARAGVPLSIGLNFRYLPVSRKLRELLADAALGAPGFGQFTYQRNRDGKQPRLNKYPLTMRHPMMLEQSIHHLDLIRFCYGREVTHVQCRTWNPSWSMYAHDANVSCLLTLEGGLEVNYLGTWTGGWDELKFEWRTDCSGGVIVQRQLFSDLAIAGTRDATLRPIEIDEARPFFDDSTGLLTAFIDAVRAKAPPPCDGPDHLRTIALCFAAIESSETGIRVDMRDFARRHGLAP